MPAMKVVIELPLYELDIENAKELIDEAGKFVRDAIVSRVKSGIGADGSPLHRPLDGGKPMDRTGQLLNSIKWKPNKAGTRGTVTPTGSRTRRGKGKAKQPSNAGVAGILDRPSNRDNDSRPAMRIMDVTSGEEEQISSMADSKIKASLASKGTRILK